MVASLTHDQAVAIYNQRKSELQARNDQLSVDVKAFVHNAGKRVEREDRAKEATALHDLDVRLENTER